MGISVTERSSSRDHGLKFRVQCVDNQQLLSRWPYTTEHVGHRESVGLRGSRHNGRLCAPKHKAGATIFPLSKEIQLILAKATEPYRTWYGLAAETGPRAGELCGLTVDDLNLDRGVLQVRLSAWRGKLGDPKSCESIRVVELSSSVCSFKELPWVMASERATATLRNAKWNTVGSELAPKTKVQTIASDSRHPYATRQWLPRLPSRERNSDG